MQHTFWAQEKCSKNYFKFSSSQKAGASGKKHRKGASVFSLSQFSHFAGSIIL